MSVTSPAGGDELNRLLQSTGRNDQAAFAELYNRTSPKLFGVPELWLIPAGANPIAVGMIAPDKPTTLALDSALLARLGPTAALAVSVEPVGGSPTGQPTGPVIAKGAIGAAPDAGAGKAAVSTPKRADRTSV